MDIIPSTPIEHLLIGILLVEKTIFWIILILSAIIIPHKLSRSK